MKYIQGQKKIQIKSHTNEQQKHRSNTLFLSFSRCAVVSTIPAGATYSYSCRGMEGRYVFVNIPGTLKILTLCEVGVYVIFPGNSELLNRATCDFPIQVEWTLS